MRANVLLKINCNITLHISLHIYVKKVYHNKLFIEIDCARLKITYTQFVLKKFIIFKLYLYFPRAKFNLVFFTNIQAFLCNEIK